MEEFEYTHDVLVKVWERTKFTVDADSEEEANIKAIEIARSKDYPDFTDYDQVIYDESDCEPDIDEELQKHPSEEIIWTNLTDK